MQIYNGYNLLKWHFVIAISLLKSRATLQGHYLALGYEQAGWWTKLIDIERIKVVQKNLLLLFRRMTYLHGTKYNTFQTRYNI